MASAEVQKYSSSFRDEFSFSQSVAAVLGAVFRYKYLLWREFKKEFVGSYRGSFFGVLWKVVLPIIPMSVYVLLHEMGILRSATGIPRVLYVVIGMTLWQLFSQILTGTTTRLDAQANLIKKVRLPLIVVYCSGLGQVLFDTLVRSIVVFTLLVTFSVQPNLTWLMYPLLMLPFILFAISVGIFLSVFSVFIRDIKHIVSVFVSYGIFASGVIFPIPVDKSEFAAFIAYANPIYVIIDATRNLLYYGSYHHPIAYLSLVLVSVVLLVFSFRKLHQVELTVTGAL